ncbi:MAG: SPOR domain-containing protein [Gammaproteobacteria bacterium]|nr:SPOR domain-containing protein [Gammaproteobacteria bacterium]NIR22911.1 SPOR domain-containing protein [Gammaproteobacteria bacterium]NIS04184.1 SPOR domain-containing protein [Gammaproteobacteria bacterium]NIV46368.1 SPOR domain-containing protein [Gammaproteobacteria bacterium]NIW01400.1 SPOR domain-containing protein [Gammaproteobacteria bacterium]
MAPRDYKHRRKGGKRSKPPRVWLWFVSGLVLGVAGTLFAQFQAYFSAEGVVEAVREVAGGDATEKRAAGAASEADKKTKKPRFEFYTMLPEMEVAVPDHELARSTTGTGRESEETGVTYVLQAGSFRKFAQADRLKAELALIGMPAQIQTVSIEGGNKWHRVRVGPFTNLQALNEARSELQSNGLKVMVLKVRS